MYLQKEQKYYMLVYDNVYTGERISGLTLKHDIAKTVEALQGQKCPCGFWTLSGWSKVKDYVLSGDYNLAL